jgi:2,4-dienoyl-CoA reductase-like NADH-dependent reductase (Old Yellow Enzyme family)
LGDGSEFSPVTDLFSTLDLGDLTVPNRLFVSPMCQYSCANRDGRATDWHLVHLGSRAVGGAGAVVVEATAVEARGRISPEDLGIWRDDHLEALEPVASFIKQQGSVPVLQLAHAGRKGSRSRPWDDTGPLQPEDGGWVAVGPSHPYPTDDAGVAFRTLSSPEISDIVTAFADGAQRAAAAGFEAVEIHAAHGYLLHQFLSPVTNEREDGYGGDFECRTRILREVLTAIRERVPDLSLWLRVSGTDWLPDRPSWDIDQTCRLANSVSELGVDLIDVSSGGIHPEQSLPKSGPSYQVELAEAVKKSVASDLAVATVGGFTAAEQADAAIRTGRADVVAVAREFLRDPYFGLHAAETLDAEDRNLPPEQYRSAF